MTLRSSRCTCGFKTMRIQLTLFAIGCAAILSNGCKKDETVSVVNYVFVTPRTIIMEAGRDTTASLSGGTPPYSIVSHAKFPTVSDSLVRST